MSTSAAQQKSKENGEYSILDNIIAETRLTPDDEAYDIAKRGVSAFIEELLKPQNNGEPVKKAMVDRMIAEIDAKLSHEHYLWGNTAYLTGRDVLVLKADVGGLRANYLLTSQRTPNPFDMGVLRTFRMPVQL